MFRILSVDVEKPELNGVAFALGAVVLNYRGEIVDDFKARCPLTAKPRSWVVEEVLPALADWPETDKDSTSMRHRFWTWFDEARSNCTENEPVHIFADCGFPAEARFFVASIDDNFEERRLAGPYPLHEVATLLLAIGVDPTGTRREDYVAELLPKQQRAKHDPHWDAYVSGLCALKALKKLNACV